jgi:hypothetical protein
MCCTLRTISQMGNESVGIGFSPCLVQCWAECSVRIGSCAEGQDAMTAGRQTDRLLLSSRKRLFFYSFVKQLCNRANKPAVMRRRGDLWTNPVLVYHTNPQNQALYAEREFNLRSFRFLLFVPDCVQGTRNKILLGSLVPRCDESATYTWILV